MRGELLSTLLIALTGCRNPKTVSTFNISSAPPAITHSKPALPLEFAPFAGGTLSNGYRLVWNYKSLPATNQIVFEVWRSAYLTPGIAHWELWTVTPDHSIQLAVTNDTGFFRVRAVDTSTRLTSDWALVSP